MFFIKSGICSGFIRAKYSKVFEDALIIFFRSCASSRTLIKASDKA